MSISCLSYGVVRVEEPGSITSLTLQDVGMVMPGGEGIGYTVEEGSSHCVLLQTPARIVVVAVNGPPVMCRSDEVGEICVQSAATGSGFWGLPGKTANVFQVRAIHSSLLLTTSLSSCCRFELRAQTVLLYRAPSLVLGCLGLWGKED